jgi:hypothetical protein
MGRRSGESVAGEGNEQMAMGGGISKKIKKLPSR